MEQVDSGVAAIGKGPLGVSVLEAFERIWGIDGYSAN